MDKNKLEYSSEFSLAFRVTIPILLGYLAIGSAFGLMIQNAGYPWYLALFMSLVIYAGAGQYAAIGMYTSAVGFIDIAIATFLINSRHLVYGISLLEKFKGTGLYKPYLIFGLTDETFGVITTTDVPESKDKGKVYFYITLLDHIYWVSGGLIGFFIGAIIPFDFAGVEFALTALFVVLLIEQWRNVKEKLPFYIATASAIVALVIFGPKNMLIISFIIALILLMAFRRRVECTQ